MWFKGRLSKSVHLVFFFFVLLNPEFNKSHIQNLLDKGESLRLIYDPLGIVYLEPFKDFS